MAQRLLEAGRLGDRDIWLDVVWSVGEPLGSAAAGTREHFPVECYSVYVARAGTIYRARACATLVPP
jgi:hypothetical protein